MPSKRSPSHQTCWHGAPSCSGKSAVLLRRTTRPCDLASAALNLQPRKRFHTCNQSFQPTLRLTECQRMTFVSVSSIRIRFCRHQSRLTSARRGAERGVVLARSPRVSTQSCAVYPPTCFRLRTLRSLASPRVCARHGPLQGDRRLLLSLHRAPHQDGPLADVLGPEGGRGVRLLAALPLQPGPPRHREPLPARWQEAHRQRACASWGVWRSVDQEARL